MRNNGGFRDGEKIREAPEKLGMTQGSSLRRHGWTGLKQGWWALNSKHEVVLGSDKVFHLRHIS